MKKIEILKLESLSRAPMLVEGYLFEGNDPEAPSVAIVGAMEGATTLPLYSASKLVDFLRNKLGTGKILGDILVIPSVNHYALNINERFWPLDKTNINMMFPGYGLGETTQRIAHKLFEAIRGYDYGIVLETRSDLATCLPYVKLYKTGYEDIESARRLGLRIIHHREPESIETVSLQYNWQLWDSKACSIVCPHQPLIDPESARIILDSLINFLNNSGIIRYETFNGYDSTVVTRERIEVVQSPHSGIFIPTKKPGMTVSKDETIGKIVHALEGEVVHRFLAPCDGMITCTYMHSLIFENAVAYRIAKIH
ncbi:MAG: succinylglutamate desuccinylase/aspartoacylase family protein [Campylobacterales bacterium]|nr:succinylglutamate desuccinylase/aspartoacylase family protein [Campylobacterales bacterium]